MSFPYLPAAFAGAVYESPFVNYYTSSFGRGLRPALHFIQCVPFANLLDTDTFTLVDIVTGGGVWQFDIAGDGTGPYWPVGPFTGTEDADGIADLVVAAIEAQGKHVACERVSGGQIYIHHLAPGGPVGGSESVADAGFIYRNYDLGSNGTGYVPLRWGLSRGVAVDEAQL